jgi:hypothetical protein
LAGWLLIAALVILAEVQDIRTEPWGYRTKEIIEYFSEK